MKCNYSNYMGSLLIFNLYCDDPPFINMFKVCSILFQIYKIVIFFVCIFKSVNI